MTRSGTLSFPASFQVCCLVRNGFNGVMIENFIISSQISFGNSLELLRNLFFYCFMLGKMKIDAKLRSQSLPSYQSTELNFNKYTCMFSSFKILKTWVWRYVELWQIRVPEGSPTIFNVIFIMDRIYLSVWHCPFRYTVGLKYFISLKLCVKNKLVHITKKTCMSVIGQKLWISLFANRKHNVIFIYFFYKGRFFMIFRDGKLNCLKDLCDHFEWCLLINDTACRSSQSKCSKSVRFIIYSRICI